MRTEENQIKALESLLLNRQNKLQKERSRGEKASKRLVFTVKQQIQALEWAIEKLKNNDSSIVD